MSASGQVVTLPDGTAVLLSGHLDLMQNDGALRPVRLPRSLWDRFPPEAESVRSVTVQASGVRIAVTTAASTLTLHARFTRFDYGDRTGPVGEVVATVDGQLVATAQAGVDQIERIAPDGSTALPTRARDSSRVLLSGLPGRTVTVTIWLPTAMAVDLLGLSGDAPVLPADPADSPVWVHHGSSISHCADAHDPTWSWPVTAALDAGLDPINLGFSGHAMVDGFVAQAIRDTPADLISLSFGVNPVGARSLDRRTFVPAVHAFLDTVRERHPHTPVLLISSILWHGSEDVPGPSRADIGADGSVRVRTCGDPADLATGALTLATSRAHLAHVARVRATRGEPTHYLDGRLLYGADDVDVHPLPDGLHPDGPLYREIGHRFARLVFADDGLLPRRTLTRSTMPPARPLESR